MFPAYGFGGALPPNNQVSFEFALNANAANPNCAGEDHLKQLVKLLKSHFEDVNFSNNSICNCLLCQLSLPSSPGIQGVVQAYQTALQNVALSGPTNCAPLIRTATNFANSCAHTPSGGQVCTFPFFV